LYDKADAIVVGTIEGVVAPGRTFSLNLRVDRAVKGTIQPAQQVFVELEIDGVRQMEVGTVTALWFLTGSPQRWSALPIVNAGNHELQDFYLRLPEKTSVERFGPPETLAPNDRLAAELAAAVEVSSDPRLIARMASFEETMPPSPVLTGILRSYVASPSQDLRAIGISGLLLSDDGASRRDGVLALAADRGMRWSGSAGANALANNLCTSRASDTESVIALGSTILKDSPDGVARCAAYALRSVHTREALPYLVALLDHPDFNIRYDAGMGLASFANNLPVHNPKANASMDWLTPLPGKAPYSTAETREHFPLIPAFKEQEDKYLNFWKVWWTTNGPAIMSGK